MQPEKIRKSLSQIEEKISKKNELIKNLEKDIENYNNDIEKLNNVITGEFLSKIQMSPMDLLNILEKKNRIILDDSKILINTEHTRINIPLDTENSEEFQELNDKGDDEGLDTKDEEDNQN